MPAGRQRIVVVETRQDAVRNLLDDQFLIGLAFLSPPEDPGGMAFHVFHIVFGTLILLISKGNGEAGPDFLCFHSEEKFAIRMPLNLFVNFRKFQKITSNPWPETGEIVRLWDIYPADYKGFRYFANGRNVE